MAVIGYVERVLKDRLRGWAFDPTATEPLKIEVLSNGEPIASGNADIFRGDLLGAGFGKGENGFEILLPKNALANTELSSLTVRVKGSNDIVPLLEKSDVVEANAIKGVVEKIEGNRVSGWAYSELRPETALGIDILAGGKAIAKTVANLLRRDLVEAEIGTGMHAFTVELGLEADIGDLEVRASINGGAKTLPRLQTLAINSQDIILPAEKSDWASADQGEATTAPAAEGRSTPDKVKSAEPKKPAPKKASHAKPILQIRGDINVNPKRTTIEGWLAVKGDAKPRTASVRVGDLVLKTVASTFRADLQRNGVNEGKHAFSIVVPGSFLNGKETEIALLDDATGQKITAKTCTWSRPIREYNTFEEFLKISMTSPVIHAPFVEQDKRAFAFMERVADNLVQKASESASPPLVSVVMPVFNRENIVLTAIKSVLEQVYTNFELIVIDDGSADGSVEKVRSVSDARLKLIPLAENVGHSAARNTGLNIAQGKYVAYLDSDNTWDPRYLAALVGAFTELADADAIYSGQILYRGDAEQPFAVRYGHYNRGLVENRNYIDLNSFSHKRSVIQQVHGFEEQLRRYVDYDLILRIGEVSTIYSIPVLLSNYFYDKADNTVTNDVKHVADFTRVIDRMRERQKERFTAAGLAQLDHHVTVVIPNWQSKEDIADCINALTPGWWNDTLDIIIVDNNSDEDVVEYLRAESQRYPNLKLIENKDNVGFTYAVNQGILAARPYSDILLLNNDAIVQPGAIQAMQRCCYDAADAGLVVPRQVLPAGTKTLTTHVPFATDTLDCDVNISAHHKNVMHVPLFQQGKRHELSYAAFFAVYIPRDTISRGGLLDAEFGRHYRSDRTYCDMVINMLRKKIYYTDDAYVIHKLQRATDTLRKKDAQSEMFELMFRRNQWDEALATKFGFRAAAWDTL